MRILNFVETKKISGGFETCRVRNSESEPWSLMYINMISSNAKFCETQACDKKYNFWICENINEKNDKTRVVGVCAQNYYQYKLNPTPNDYDLEVIG